MVPPGEQSITAVSRPAWRPSGRRMRRDIPTQPSLQRNFLWTLAGNILYAACQWGVLVCLAKLGSPEIVGRFGLGLAITAPVIMFSQLHLRAVLATDSRQEFRFGDYLALRLILTAAALAVIAGLALIGGYARETVLVIIILGLGKAAESIADVYYAWFQQHERMDRSAQALMLQGVLALAAVGVSLAMSRSIVWATAGWAAAAGASLWLCILPNARRLAHEEGRRSKEAEASTGGNWLWPRWRMRRLLRLTWIALPLGVVTMLISLQVNIPRYYLEVYRGETELGIYTALAYLPAAGNLVMQALGQAASPKLARHHAAGERRAFRRLLLHLLGLGLIGGAAGLLLVALAGAPLLRRLYTLEYAGHVGLLGLLATAMVINYLAFFLGYAMTAARVFRAQVPLFALVTLATAAACWLWVPRHGMQGAAWSLIAGATVHLIGSGLLVVLSERNLGGRQYEG
jgi:O-antigen/teichoic acid export membrane protein